MKAVYVIMALLLVGTVSAYDYDWAAEQDAKAAEMCIEWRAMKDATLKYPLPSWAPCPYSCNMGVWMTQSDGDPVCVRPRVRRKPVSSFSSAPTVVYGPNGPYRP